MTENILDHLKEGDRSAFLDYCNRFKSITDIKNVADILSEAIQELTIFNYTLLFLYRPERNVITGLGPSGRSPVIRKTEKFIDLKTTDIEADLSGLPEIKKIIKKKKPLELDDVGTVDLLQRITGRTKTQVRTLVNFLKTRKSMVQPLTVFEGQMQKETVVGILIVSTPEKRLERMERLKISLLSQHISMVLCNELIQRRLRRETEERTKDQGLFEAMNLAALDLQMLFEEDAIFKAVAKNLSMAGFGLLVLEKDPEKDNLVLRHFTVPKAVQLTMMKILDIDILNMTIRAAKAPSFNDMFKLKKPRFIDNLHEMGRIAIQAKGLLRHKKKVMKGTVNKTAVICPLWIKDRCDRLLVLSRDDLAPRDVLPIEVLALHVRNAMERIQILKENEEKTKQIRFMHDLSGALTKSLDIETILGSLKKEISKVHRFEFMSLLLMESNLNDGVHYIVTSPGTDGPSKKVFLNLTDKQIRKVTKISEMLVEVGGRKIKGFPEDKVFGGNKLGTRTVLPLQVENTFLGTLNLGCRHEQCVEGFLKETVASIREPLSTALYNANVLVEERRRSDQLKVISEVSKLTTKFNSVESLYREMVRLLSTTFGLGAVHMVKYDREKDTIGVMFSSEPEIVERLKGYSQPAGSGVIGRAIKRKRSIIVPNVEEDPDFIPVLEDVRSELVVPVITDGEIEVLINIERTEYNAFDDQDVLTIETLANEISVMIRTLRMGKMEEKRVGQLSLINEIGREILPLIDVDEIMRNTVHLIEEKFHYTDVSIFMVDPERNMLVLKAISESLREDVPIGFQVKRDSGVVGQVLRKGETILLNDITKHKNYLSIGTSSQKSELCCPIKFDEVVIGVLNIESPIKEAFDEWDRLAMESLALMLGRAIDKGKVFQEAERKSQLLETVNEISLDLSKELHRQRIMDVFTEHFQRSRNYLDVAVFLIGPKGKVLVKAAQAGDYKGRSPSDYSQSTTVGLFGICLKKKKTVIINDVSKDKRYKSMPWVKTRAEMISPIKLGDRIIGIVNVESDKVGAFDDWDRLAVETLTRNLAIALQNADLLEEERKRSGLLIMLNEISSQALKAKDIDALFQKSCETILSTFDFYNISIFIKDERKWPMNILQVRANYGAYVNLAAPGSEFPSDEGLVGACFTTGKPIVVNDTSTDKRFIPEPSSETRSELCMPLWSGGKVIGVLNIESDKKDHFQQWETMAMETISEILSRAIDNLHQLDEQTRHTKDLSTVMDIEKELASQLETDIILNKVVDLVQGHLGYYNVEFYILDKESYDFELIARRGIKKASISPGFRQNIDTGIIGRAYRSKKPVIINDAVDYRTHFEALGKVVRSALTVPVIVQNEIIGMLNIEGEEPNEFDEWDSLVLKAISDLLAGAMDRARRFKDLQMRERQFKIAYEIGDELAVSRSLDDLNTKAVRLIKKKFSFFHVELLTLETDEDHLILRAMNGAFRKGRKVGTKVPRDECLTGWCLSKGVNVVVNDMTVDPRCMDTTVTDSKSEIVVLIRKRKEIYGVLVVKSRHFDAFSDWDLLALELVAKQIENLLRKI